LKPDLVLMDVRMPQMDGLEATLTIKAEQPEISVLVITTYENPDYLLEAVKAGATGYVLKDAPNQRVLSAMRRALEGESPVNQELATKLIERLASEASHHAEPPSPSAPEREEREERGEVPALPLLDELTPRELEVLGLVAQGKTNQEIAKSLFISGATAKVHVQRIIRKLRVSDRTQAVVRAFELGLVRYPRT
jgi:two-component system response regulator DegU